MFEMWYHDTNGYKIHLKYIYKEGGFVDYMELYLKMMRASEEAINILVEAQRECEEMYIRLSETEQDEENK